MGNREKIIAEFEEYKGQFVINDDWKVVRLIAVGDDEFDYYWVYWDGRKITWASCCGGFVPLKGKVDDDHYQRFINMAYWNHYDLFGLHKEDKEKDETKKALWKTMRDRVKMEAIDTRGKGNYITDICWEIV
jgi:hypothetical protein